MALTYEDLVDKLARCEPFAFSRFGDGEWNAILGKHGRNCDGHEYYQDMGECLQNILMSKPSYFLGMQDLGLRQNTGKPQFENLRRLNTWGSADIMHNASIKQKLEQMFEALATRKVCIVGNDSLRNFKGWDFVSVPQKNCWIERERICDDVRAWVKMHADDHPVVLFCAGMPSNVFVDTLHNEFGRGATFIDCGSVFDPYVGVCSRKYHTNILTNLKK